MWYWAATILKSGNRAKQRVCGGGENNTAEYGPLKIQTPIWPKRSIVFIFPVVSIFFTDTLINTIYSQSVKNTYILMCNLDPFILWPIISYF